MPVEPPKEISVAALFISRYLVRRRGMFRRLSRKVLIVLYGGGWMMALLLFPWEALAQNTTTFTVTSTNTNLLNNPVLGCAACASIPNHDPSTVFPDTSTPLFQGDPRAADLPRMIASALPPNNQFGVGIPAGDSGTPLFHSTPFNFRQSNMALSVKNEMASLPIASGRSNTFSSRISQTVTPTPGTAEIGGQQFSILFSINSLTDPDGNLIGSATGTFTQEIDGVVTQGTIQFDSVNGFSGTNLHEPF
jgi:hypothetical protein